jgi:hypothetical protein
MNEKQRAAWQARLDRWERLIGWEPEPSDGEADMANTVAFDDTLDAIRSLPRDKAARLLIAMAEAFVRQGAESVTADQRKRGNPATTAVEHADLLCAIEEAKGATKDKKRKAVGESRNIGAEAVRKAERNARRALGLEERKVEAKHEGVANDWPTPFRTPLGLGKK